MSFKALSLIVCLLIGLSTPLNLVPDINNPVSMQFPSTIDNGAVISVRFYFPPATPNALGPVALGSTGLSFRQFIGVQFPTLTNLFTQTSQFSCALSDSSGATYDMESKIPTATLTGQGGAVETNLALCQLVARTNVPLKTGPANIYTLNLTLNIKFSTTLLPQINFFTATSENADRMILDSLPVLGTASLYGDYRTFATKSLAYTSVVDTKVNVGPSAGSTTTQKVYPYNEFELSFNLKVNTHITAADHLIVFKYPSDTVSRADTVFTSDIEAANTLKVGLKGDLKVREFGTDGIVIDGINEDLYPDREFKITLKGWTAKDTVVDTNKDLWVQVIYKNTSRRLSRCSQCLQS